MSFLFLLFAHLLADYPLQGDFLAKMKGKNLIILFTHAGIWTGTVLTAAYLLGYDVNYIDIVWMFAIHAVADYGKANSLGVYRKLDALKGGLLLDQLIHVLQIIAFLLTKTV
jgi:hypothetical protein